MTYGFGMGRGRGFGGRGGGFGGRGGGRGFGFRGSSPPWPYVGLGRGGLPRCGYYLDPASPGYERSSYAAPWGTTTMTSEQELDYLKDQAEGLKRELQEIDARLSELGQEQEE